MGGIANAPRIEAGPEDFVLTNDGILRVVFKAGVLALLIPPLMRRARNVFYEVFADASPVGMDGVTLIPWSEITSARVFTTLARARGYSEPIIPTTHIEIATREEVLVARKLDPRLLDGLVPLLSSGLGERFDNDYDEEAYERYRQIFANR